MQVACESPDVLGADTAIQQLKQFRGEAFADQDGTLRLRQMDFQVSKQGVAPRRREGQAGGHDKADIPVWSD